MTQDNKTEETATPLVCPFYYRGDDSRPMRVVVSDGAAEVEEQDGHDALGVERWCSVDLDAMDPDVHQCDMLLTEPREWVAMVALAVAYKLRPDTGEQGES